METYETLKAAQQEAREDGSVQAVIEIEHADKGRCYIAAKCDIERLRKALKQRPIEDIDELVTEHPRRPQVITDEAQVELGEIRALRGEAGRCEDTDYARTTRLRVDADERQEQWEEDYPRAAAYLQAKSYAHASNYRKVAAGKRAMAAIEDGEDYEAAVEQMETAWREHCKNKQWA